MATDPNLEATVHAATPHRAASLVIDVQGFAYDRSQHSDGTTLVVKGVTAEDLRGLAADLLEQAGLLEPEPTKPARSSTPPDLARALRKSFAEQAVRRMNQG
jgi:hypothetical protein